MKHKVFCGLCLMALFLVPASLCMADSGAPSNEECPVELHTIDTSTQKTALKYAHRALDKRGDIFDSICMKGVYVARSMWDQEDMSVVTLEVVAPGGTDYYYVLVGCETGEVYPPNTDFASLFRVSAGKYITYFDPGWVSRIFKINGPEGAQLDSCLFVRVTEDTPDSNGEISDVEKWGPFVWLVKDTEGNHYFLTYNGRVHKIELSPSVAARVYQSHGKD